jgi:hypothetical protein
MENRDKKLNLPTEIPYLGYHGVGARMEISVGKKQWILRETTRSQMFLILSLGLLAFFPLWVLVYKTNEVKGGITSQIILSVVSVVAAIFFYKYLSRFVSNRRIVFDLLKKEIKFYNQKRKEEFIVSFLDVLEYEIVNTDFYSDGIKTPNYSIRIKDKKGINPVLFTGDNKNNIENICATIKKLLSIN